MTFDLTKIMQSKREFRQRLAAKPIEEKLAMLDALRARIMALRGSRAEQPGSFARNLQHIRRNKSMSEKDQLLVHSLVRVCGYLAGWLNEKQIYQGKQTG